MSSTTRSIPLEVESIEELYSNKMYQYKPPAPTPLATITEEGETAPRRNWQKLRFFNFENLSKEEEREKTRRRKAKAMKNPGYRKRMKAGAKARARKIQFPDVLEHIEHIMSSSGCVDRSGNVTPIATSSSSSNGFLTASSCGSSQTDTSGGGDDTWHSTTSTGQSTSDGDTPGGVSVVVEEYEELLADTDLMVEDDDEEDLFNQAIIVSPLTPMDEFAEQEIGHRIWQEEMYSRGNVCGVDGTDFNVDIGKIVKDDVQIATDCASAEEGKDGSQDNHIDVGYFANVNEEEFIEHVLDTSHIPSFLNSSGDGKDVEGELQLLPMFCDEDDNDRSSGKKGGDKPLPRRSMRIAEMRRCSLVVDEDVSPAVPSASSSHRHRRKRRNQRKILIVQGDKNDNIHDGSSGTEGAGSGIPPVYNLRGRICLGLLKPSYSTPATSYLPLPRKTLPSNSLLQRRPRQTSSTTKHKLHKAKKQSKSKKETKLSASSHSSPITASSTIVSTVTTEPEHHPVSSMSSPMQCVTVAGAHMRVKMSGDAVVDEENGDDETVVEDVLHGLSSLRVSDVNSTDGPNHIDPEPSPSIPLTSPISHSNSMTTPHTPTPCLTTPHTHSPSSHKSPVFRQVLQDVSNTIPSPIYCGNKATGIQVPLPERDC